MTARLRTSACEGCGSIRRPITGLWESKCAMRLLYQVCRYCADRLMAYPDVRQGYMPFTLPELRVRFGRFGRDPERPEFSATYYPPGPYDGY